MRRSVGHAWIFVAICVAAACSSEPAEFDLVFDVKADGWFNLLHALRESPPAATVAFSSIAGRLGNAGQTDYSAANDLLCKAASHLRRTHPETRALAIDWTDGADPDEDWSNFLNWSTTEPTAADTVTVHYHGTFPDGKSFDSSVNRGQPATFPLSGVISAAGRRLRHRGYHRKFPAVGHRPQQVGHHGDVGLSQQVRHAGIGHDTQEPHVG